MHDFEISDLINQPMWPLRQKLALTHNQINHCIGRKIHTEDHGHDVDKRRDPPVGKVQKRCSGPFSAPERCYFTIEGNEDIIKVESYARGKRETG